MRIVFKGEKYSVLILYKKYKVSAKGLDMGANLLFDRERGRNNKP